MAGPRHAAGGLSNRAARAALFFAGCAKGYSLSGLRDNSPRGPGGGPGVGNVGRFKAATRRAATVAAAAVLAAGLALAQAPDTTTPASAPAAATATPANPSAGGVASGQVYRCPGPPDLYTDRISASEARERGCRTLEGAPITVVQSPRPRPTPAASANGASAPRPADGRVDPGAQRQRDSDARRILEAELRREEDKAAGLRREFNNGEPERRGDERNYQSYLDRVAQMRSALQRSESDIVALRRELTKLQAAP